MALVEPSELLLEPVVAELLAVVGRDDYEVSSHSPLACERVHTRPSWASTSLIIPKYCRRRWRSSAGSVGAADPGAEHGAVQRVGVVDRRDGSPTSASS